MDYEYGANCLPLSGSTREGDTDFARRFPSDALGHEMGAEARVWRVYREEAKASDNALLEGWSSTLDILLIFAGLFSAVATAFVIESYQLLQPDNAAYTAAALWILVAASNHSTGVVLPPPPDLTYASPLTRWINGLWFTSILLSLAVALLAILVKQWIKEYLSRTTATAKLPRDWALRREAYFQALTSWPVAELVSVLPLFLHLSLFLFFSGLIAFLWTIDRAIGVWAMVLASTLGGFYLVCTLIPLWIVESPTSTPLIHHLRKAARPALFVFLRMLHSTVLRLESVLQECMKYCRALRPHATSPMSRLPIDEWNVTQSRPVRSSLSRRLEEAAGSANMHNSTMLAITTLVERKRVKLEASALLWLIRDVPDSNAVAVALQALGAIHPESPLVERLRRHDALVGFVADRAFVDSPTRPGPLEVDRVARSVLCMCRAGETASLPGRISALHDPIHTNTTLISSPDAALLCLPAEHILQKAVSWRGMSSALTSTALLAIRGDRTTLKWRLSYLLCCDFERFTELDWKTVILALYAHGTQEFGSSTIRMRSREVCQPLCLADLLLQLVPRCYNDPRETAPTYQLIHTILTVVLADPDSVRNPPREAISIVFPTLGQYLVESQHDADLIGIDQDILYRLNLMFFKYH